MPTTVIDPEPAAVGGARPDLSFAASNSTVSALPPRGMPLVVSKDELYFWTASWQASEARADADIAAGRVHSFESANDAIAYLIEHDQT